MRVLVTRTQPEADRLASRVRARGDEVVVWPAFTIAPLVPTVAEIAAARAAQIVILVSANAVRFGLPHLACRSPAQRFATVGASTQALLRDAGIVALAPASEGANGLLALPELRDVAGLDVAIVRGRGGLASVDESLRRRGAHVHVVTVYERLPAATALLANEAPFAAICTSSGEALAGVASALAAGNLRVTDDAMLIVPSPRVATLAAATAAVARLRIVDAGSASDAATLAVLDGGRS